MRTIKVVSTVLIVVFWLIMSLICGNNLLYGENTLNTIFVMTGSFLYGSLTLWLLYGFTGKKYEAVFRWIAVSLAVLPTAVLITILYLLRDVDVEW